MNIHVLVCEDETKYIERAKKLLNTLFQYGFKEVNVHTTTTTNECIEAIMKNDYELFIIDIIMKDKGGGIDREGGVRIIQAIADKYYNSSGKAIQVPIFQYTQYPEEFSNILINLKEEYPDACCKHLPFKDDEPRFLKDNQKLLLEAIEQVQKNRIKLIDNMSGWSKLLNAIHTNNYSGLITINNEEWLISDFLFPEIIFDNIVYFKRKKIINEINNLLLKAKGPKKGIWNKNPELKIRQGESEELAKKRQKNKINQAIKLHNIATKLLNEKKALNKIKEKTEEWYDEYLRITKDKSYRSSLFLEWSAKTDPFGSRIIKYNKTQQVILNKLIWRRIVIKLYSQKSIVHEEYRTTKWIAGIEKNGWLTRNSPTDPSQDSDEKKLFDHLGFEYRLNVVKINNLFPEEEDFLTSLNPIT